MVLWASRRRFYLAALVLGAVVVTVATLLPDDGWAEPVTVLVQGFGSILFGAGATGFAVEGFLAVQTYRRERPVRNLVLRIFAGGASSLLVEMTRERDVPDPGATLRDEYTLLSVLFRRAAGRAHDAGAGAPTAHAAFPAGWPIPAGTEHARAMVDDFLPSMLSISYDPKLQRACLLAKLHLIDHLRLADRLADALADDHARRAYLARLADACLSLTEVLRLAARRYDGDMDPAVEPAT
jgi:hypothetical protein